MGFLVLSRNPKKKKKKKMKKGRKKEEGSRKVEKTRRGVGVWVW